MINGIASSPLMDVYNRKKFDQWFYKRGKRGMQRELEELLSNQDRQGFVN